MSWADPYIADLLAGLPVSFRPKGNSMSPRIKSGQLVTVTPRSLYEIKVDDIVLCKVNGKQYLHIVKNKSQNSQRFLIGNNRGGTNGWTTHVYGVVTEVTG